MEKNILREEKKSYAKPVAKVVDFSLSSSVAGSCVHYGNFQDGDVCICEDNETIMFSTQNTSCGEWPVEGDYCYQVPFADTSIFTS